MFEKNETRLVYSSKEQDVITKWRHHTLRGPQFDKKECEKVFKEFIREKYPYHAEVWDVCNLYATGYKGKSQVHCPVPLHIVPRGRGPY